jgi:MFS superfamily sulfate permease-like transporter
MTDFPCTRAFVNGVIIGVSLSIFSFFVYTLKPNSQPMTPKSTFEVIDTYKGCDVVQYTNEYLSHYNYFLDCKK